MRDSADVGGWIELSGSQERKGRERRDYLIVRRIAGRKASVRSSVAVRQEEERKWLAAEQTDECNIRNWRCRLARSDLRSMADAMTKQEPSPSTWDFGSMIFPSPTSFIPCS